MQFPDVGVPVMVYVVLVVGLAITLVPLVVSSPAEGLHCHW